MKRRNYLQSVASLPLLSGISLPSLFDSESEKDDEFPYVIEAMWHRGSESGRIYTDEFQYEYDSYNRWEASAVVHSSLKSVDIVPELSGVDGIRLISVSDEKQGHSRILMTANEQDLDISLSTRHMNQVKFHQYDGKNHYVKCENLASVKKEIKERI